jgi:hypothetical protein
MAGRVSGFYFERKGEYMKNTAAQMEEREIRAFARKHRDLMIILSKDEGLTKKITDRLLTKSNGKENGR